MVRFKIESWLWWSFVIVVAASRFISRRMTLGAFRRYQADDYLMMVVLCFYTTFLVTINIVAVSQSNLFPPGYDISSITEAERRSREYGSKLTLVLEQCQCVTIWGAKTCLIILYLRLTTLRWQHNAIRALLGYVIVTFVVMEVLYLGVWCRPFHEYWAVPTNSSQCDAATNHLITNAVFNLSSDVIMLAVGLPIFLRMKLPWRKKIPLVGIFSLGIFVVLAAILNKVYSFSQPFGAEWTYWYVRESSTALLVANLPFVWRFWRKLGGFKTSVAGSRTATKIDTNLSAPGHYGRRDGPMNMPDFITQWPLYEDEECASPEKDLRRQGARGRADLTLEEFLRDDRKCSTGDAPSESEGIIGPAPERAVVNDGKAHDTVRRDSNPEKRLTSTPASSAVPSSMDGSRSASSFV